MVNNTEEREPLLCPSARPEMGGSVIFGVIGGTVEEPRLIHLVDPLPVTDELLALANPVTPAEVFRFAAPCATSCCRHFDGQDCQLAVRTVQLLSPVADTLPPCRVRPQCRWWQQEGKAACMRCPQIVTDNYAASPLVLEASGTARMGD